MPFSHLSDEKLEMYIPMFQDFIFCYRHEDKDKEEMLQEIWKMLTLEDLERKSERDELDSFSDKSTGKDKSNSSGIVLKKRSLVKKIRC